MTPNRPGRNCRRKRRRLEDHGRLDQLLAHAARAGPARRDHPADRGQLRYRARDARLAHAKGADIILAARKILLLVSGAHKADVLRRTLEEEISDDLPATHLRGAPDVTVIADRAAWPAATAAGLLDGSRAVAPREDVGSSR